MGIYGLSQSWSVLRWKACALLIATGIVHLLYTECLMRGYRASDLSVVYPLARGTGPLLSFAGAILILHERASVLSVCGALLITSGILVSSGGIQALRHRLDRAGLFWGLATGLTIACYTLADGYSVKTLLLSPLLVEYAGNLFRALWLSVETLRRPTPLAAEYRPYWKYMYAVRAHARRLHPRALRHDHGPGQPRRSHPRDVDDGRRLLLSVPAFSERLILPFLEVSGSVITQPPAAPLPVQG